MRNKIIDYLAKHLGIYSINKSIDKIRHILSDQRDRIDCLSKEVQRLKTNKNKNNGRKKDTDTRSRKEASGGERKDRDK